MLTSVSGVALGMNGSSCACRMVANAKYISARE